jgi:hypothetical protein
VSIIEFLEVTFFPFSELITLLLQNLMEISLAPFPLLASNRKLTGLEIEEGILVNLGTRLSTKVRLRAHTLPRGIEESLIISLEKLVADISMRLNVEPDVEFYFIPTLCW